MYRGVSVLCRGIIQQCLRERCERLNFFIGNLSLRLLPLTAVSSSQYPQVRITCLYFSFKHVKFVRSEVTRQGIKVFLYRRDKVRVMQHNPSRTHVRQTNFICTLPLFALSQGSRILNRKGDSNLQAYMTFPHNQSRHFSATICFA